jgi:hypothetical protein
MGRHPWMNGRLWMRRLALVLLALLVACVPRWLPVVLPAAAPGVVAHPVVFVPGLTGAKLRDPRDGALIWGATAQLLRPHDGGYRLALPLVGDDHPQARYRAIEPVWQMRLPGFARPIYRPLVEHFARRGYRFGELTAPAAGDGLYFFDYDWRRSNFDSVRLLDQRLEALRVARGGELAVDLICQSNAGKICRYLVKYGTRTPEEAVAGVTSERRYRVRKVIFVGASNNGALRSLEMLLEGRRYIRLIGRTLLPETVFTIRPLFEDLPGERDDLFFDASGETVTVDLFDPEKWLEYGWSIFGREVEERLDRRPRPDLFGTPADRRTYLTAQLEHSRRVEELLTRDAPGFPRDVRYYRLENESTPTLARALLAREGGEWRTYFAADRRVSRDPALAALAVLPGDGHATLVSQRRLSPQEDAVMTAATLVTGGHFSMVIEPPGLEALIGFLED